MDVRDPFTSQAVHFEEQKRDTPSGEAGLRTGNCGTKAQAVLLSAYHCCPNGKTIEKSHD